MKRNVIIREYENKTNYPPMKNRRKGPRQIHIINEKSSDRDIELAKSDLTNFFLDCLDKHHGF